VNCSATVARAIADRFRRDIHSEALAKYPNVDGVIALTHGAAARPTAPASPLQVLRRTLGVMRSTRTSRRSWSSGSAARRTRSPV